MGISNEVTVCKMQPDEIERLLAAQYGKKIAAVDPVKMAKRNQRIAKTNSKCK
ncbi:MAG: hypothetical protein H6Q65_680 [Firmicutes bacterium]|nr:hypothetical protein [Bacillota bacterium]